jgi:hypothetical protein
MVVIERKECKSQQIMLENEIKSLQELINKREKWLADPLNKKKGTYSAVKNDTDELRQDLQEAKAEYQELLNKQ